MTRRWIVGFAVASLVYVLVAVALAPAKHTYVGAGFTTRHQASFEGNNGKESGRQGINPATEQVDNRAYPRSYVDDRLAQQSHSAYSSKPGSLDRSAFRSDAAYRAALSTNPGAWKLLGPVTPNVSGNASQYWDPATGVGPTTQESGRVTALAIDPNCGKPSAPSGAPCRLWVAAAGGGVWRTNNALAATPAWIKPPLSLPTNAFGSLIVDPNDAGGNTLYAGSGEPNGSGDSEAGLGLFKSTNGGQSWSLVAGSESVALNRSIGSLAVKPGSPNTIYIGTDVARHGSASVNGGRRTPPNAPPLGFYKSTDGGAHFAISTDLKSKTPQNPTDPGAGTGTDWFQGGVRELRVDPNNANTVYAGIYGYGLWRSTNGGTTWTQIFHTVNQTDFSTGAGDTFGDRTDFSAVKVGTNTRLYVGDSSDDLAVAQVWRTDDAAAVTGDANGNFDNAGWTELSDSTNGTNGFLAYYYCQNGQCGYDNIVASPAGQLGVGAGHTDELWLGGSMNYDELAAYAGIDRSNGRGVIRSTNAGDAAADVTWADMSATMGSAPNYPVIRGIHPDEQYIQFYPVDPGIAFVGSDGGVVRIDVRSPKDKSADCATRVPALAPADLVDCQRLLSAIPSTITPLNNGLATIQFQSLSFNPGNPTKELLGGTQDNGTWGYTGSTTWLENVGGDGGQSGFDAGDTNIRYHNYYDATPEVNFHGNDPNTWVAIYDPLQSTKEARSFYVPFTADPRAAGRAFIGLQHVWRTEDNGGDQAYLEAYCNALAYGPLPGKPCGDWRPIGDDLTGNKFGQDRAGQYVVATVRAPSDNGTLWAGTRIGRLFVTNNADANPGSVKFYRIDTPETPGRFVSGVAVDQHDPNHAWVSYTGYSAYTPDTPGHVFDVHYDPSTHQATFTDISYDLGDQPVTGIAQFGATGDVYVSTDFGVLRLPAGATAWQKAGIGLPSVATYGVTLTQVGRRLYAATHGRGAWSLTLPT